MILKRPLLSLDLETTDADPATCAIFEFGAVVMLPDGRTKSKVLRFKPWKPITPKASDVTGVSDEMVAASPPFAEYAERICKFMQGKDLLGFNLRRFDLICIDEEFRRASNGILKLDLNGVSVIDAGDIFKKKHPRTLSDAVRIFCSKEHDGAHNAGVDAAATLQVLAGQLKAYPELDSLPIDELAAYSNLSDKPAVDLAGKLYRDEEGFACYAFGKNKDKRVKDDFGYYQWIMKQGNFPGSTIDALREEADRLRKEKHG